MPAESCEFVLSHERDASRYTLMRDGVLLSALDYRDDGSTVAMTRAFTVPAHRGHGYAGLVVEGAVADIESRGDRRIDPVCWYVAEWFESHPDKKALLRQR